MIEPCHATANSTCSALPGFEVGPVAQAALRPSCVPSREFDDTVPGSVPAARYASDGAVNAVAPVRTNVALPSLDLPSRPPTIVARPLVRSRIETARKEAAGRVVASAAPELDHLARLVARRAVFSRVKVRGHGQQPRRQRFELVARRRSLGLRRQPPIRHSFGA